MISAMFASAQCVEVKGVETRRVKEPEKGYEFTNLNDYTITIEAELQRHVCAGAGPNEIIIDTKSFVIKPEKTYVWKAPFDIYHRDCGRMDTFVKFKAFKCP